MSDTRVRDWLNSMRAKHTKLHQQVLKTIRSHGMLPPGSRVGVAVSGGADSVALLLLLEELRAKLGITLLVLHFNHSLRGAESEADEQFVAALARDRNVEFISAREDVAAQARENGWNLEDAARRLRYGFFARVVEQGAASRVAVAHTADDQAETVIARLIRGTGLDGLAGIHPVVGPVVRPLLDVSRRVLRDYLSRAGQAWREDSSNLDIRRLRARIRHQLLPQLETNFSATVVERLDELARLARGESMFWSAFVEDRFRALARQTPDGFSIHIPDLLVPLEMAHAQLALSELNPTEVSRALAQRLVRRVFEAMFGGPAADRHELAARNVEQVLRLAEQSSSGRQVHLPGGVVVERSFDRLFFSRRDSSQHSLKGRETLTAVASSYEYRVDVPARGSATVSVPELGRRFRLKVIDWPTVPSDTKWNPDGPEMTTALDAGRLRSPLLLRNWRPGDTYRPMGRRQAQKLKRLFLAERIGVRDRSRWPVLVSGEKLVWVRGMPPAEGFAAGEGTRTGLVVAEESL